MPSDAWGVALSGNYAYVADDTSGLQIIDISDPANPTFKSSYDTPRYAHGVALSGNYAYVADSNSGLQVIASNLDKLTLSGTPSSVGTYSVDVEACNEAEECITDSFYIIVKYSDDTIDDTTDTTDTIDTTDPTSITDTTDLTTTLTIIGCSIAVAVCTASFCSTLIIGGGIVAFRRYFNKDESNTNAKEQKKEEVQQKSESTTPSNDVKIVVENEPVVQQEKVKVFEYDLVSSEQKVPLKPEYTKDVELDVL